MTSKHPNVSTTPSPAELQILIAEAGGKKNLSKAIAEGEERLSGDALRILSAPDQGQLSHPIVSFKEGIGAYPEKKQDSDFINKTARRAAREHGLPAAHLSESSTHHAAGAS